MNLSSSLGAGGPSSLTVLSEDGERVLCRGWRDDGDGDRTAVLAVLSASEHPTPGFFDRLAHEYGLKDELDGLSAARPLALVREHGRTMLLLEDPGGEPLDPLLGRPMEMGRFLLFATGISAALRQLHERGKQVVEPVFGQIKQARGFRQFLLRGVKKVRAEWAMICTTTPETFHPRKGRLLRRLPRNKCPAAMPIWTGS